MAYALEGTGWARASPVEEVCSEMYLPFVLSREE